MTWVDKRGMNLEDRAKEAAAQIVEEYPNVSIGILLRLAFIRGADAGMDIYTHQLDEARKVRKGKPS